MAMLTIGQLLRYTDAESQGRDGRSISQRAATVSVHGNKSGFRSGWKVPDTAYWGAPGVQEILFVTQASDSKTDRRFRQPYKTIFRFPLEQATGQPYDSGTGANDLPVYVTCSCPAFRYYSEVALMAKSNTDQIESNGQTPRINNPGMKPYVCKHLFATAKAAMLKRATVGVTATVATLQDDPAKPKNRNPETPEPTSRAHAGRKTPDVSSTASKANTLPQTWLGRLNYILFNQRQGR
jgi:hypothetical protein